MDTDIDMLKNNGLSWGAWVSQSVECPTLAQVMISQLLGSSSALGSVLTAQSLEPASDSVSPSLSLSTRALSLSLSLSQINIKKRYTSSDIVY